MNNRRVVFTSWGAAAIICILLLSRCFKPLVEESENSRGLLRVIRHVPISNQFPHGALEVSIKNRQFLIPNEYTYLPVESERKDGMWIRFRWPSLNPVSSENPRSEWIQVLLIARRDSPAAVTKDYLERVIVALHEKPKQLRDYPDVQEYPSNNTRPHFRSTDPSHTWADGLPSYFYCAGDAISLGDEPRDAGEFTTCEIQLTWPDSFLVDIKFNKRHFRDWRAIHDKVMLRLREFQLHPTNEAGTLLAQ